jgi:glyoxylase-like metal-dependent hydrolase (beta-lactamase superfamily II)
VRGMFSRACPPVEMTTRFFIGAPCTVDRHVEAYAFKGAITPVPLAGHTLGHTGYLCSKVFLTRDALYTTEVWGRDKLPYSIDVELTRWSLNAISKTAFDWLIRATARCCQRKRAPSRSRFTCNALSGLTT